MSLRRYSGEVLAADTAGAREVIRIRVDDGGGDPPLVPPRRRGKAVQVDIRLTLG